MNDFQILSKNHSKLSLYRNYKSNTKPKNMPQGLKSILITNSNGLEISSQFGNFLHFSKKNMLDDNFSFKRITTNYNKNATSYPVNTASNMKNVKNIDGPIINLKSNLYKKKFEKYLTNSKKNDYSKSHNSKDRTNSNINIMNNINGLMLNRSNLKLNIIPKKSNFKYMNFRENNLSVNSNKNLGKSTSISKSKSKSKNKRENKSYNNNITQMFFNKYLKIKLDKMGYRKKTHKKSFNYLNNKESPRYINNKFSKEINISDINKLNSFNLIKNIQFRGARKKNKSSNLLINNINTKTKNNHNSRTNSNNIIISRIETNKNINSKNSNNNKILNKNSLVINNNNINNNIKINKNKEKNGKKYLTENHIMYIVNKKNSGKNKHQKKPLTNNTNKNNKEISLKEIKNETNHNININSKNDNSNNHINIHKLNKNNNITVNKPKIEITEKVIYDYKTNKKYQNMGNNLSKDNKDKHIYNKKQNNLINNTNTNPNINEIENSVNTYKVLNERLKTEYNDISLEAIDKMYEQEQDTYDMNINNKNTRSKKNSEDNSFRFYYPDGDIYNRDDEFFIENNDENLDNNEKREKELDETESPLKMDTDKATVENSGVLSFDQVKDIICYYNMNNTDKQSEFLFQNKEREIFDMNYKNKYLNFFFGKKENENLSGFGMLSENNNNDIMDDMLSLNTFNLKYPNNSIFSIDTEYSSKMKKKYNKNLVKNI